MIINFEDTFDKDINNIKETKILYRIEQASFNVRDALTMHDIRKLKKLKGYKFFYRIRVGDYRIGVTIIGDTVTFLKCLPRKDFYKHFPPK